ncbi:MAG: OmpH family outer membrane protein [Pseudomonadota bacterium]
MRALLATLVLAAVLAGGALGQGPSPPFLVIDQDRLLSTSETGREVLAAEAMEREALQREGEALDRQFEAEERDLTERRQTLDPETFRALADAFDEKVVATRRRQEQKAIAITRDGEERRRAFFEAVTPILVELLQETGAAAVVDHRSLLISKQDLNITDEVIKRLDQRRRDAPAAAPGQTEN